ncbi:MAG TPA: DUF742 domain-containing protein [Amycolatopsis sp.]|jgi:hypothetical protein|nr:DUF742 domain-containing protein [Amycolatopsis sp.]
MTEPGATPGRHREPDAQALPLVRPYARSGAASHVTHELALETLVSTTDSGRRLSRLLREPYGSACELCVSTVSVAELSAYLGLSLGSARELVEVLVAEQLLQLHPTVGDYGPERRATVLGRMLDELGDL